jgi:hypothetical protein
MATIDAKTKKIFPNIRASMGLFYDTNVSAGPDESNIQVPGGGRLNLTQEQGEQGSLVWMFNMAGNVVYDFGDKNGWMWNTTGSFFNTHVFEYPQYDFLQWRLTSGSWWVGRNSILKIPLGYAQTTFEHDHLYDTWDLSPSYEYFFTNWFSVRGLLAYARDTYEPSAPPDDQSGQNNLNRIWEINPNLYLNNRQDILSFFYTGENLNAKEPRFSYDAANFALSYYKRFRLIGWDMELYTRFKYTKRDYDTAALLWPADQPREDDRYNFYIVLSRNFCKHFFASASYNWIRNESNTDLYDFTKQVWGLNAGIRF